MDMTEQTLADNARREVDYRDLIDRVRAIRPSAAEWLESEEARGMPDFVPDGDIWCIFTWEDSPQGHEFWSNIADALERSRTDGP